MKRLCLALVMLCVFVLGNMIQMNQDLYVYAEACEGELQIEVPQEDVDIIINGDEIDYLEGVKVFDSCGNDVTETASLTVDSSSVKLDEVGVYSVGYMALVDGNIGAKSINIHVKLNITPPELSGYYEKYLFLQGDELADNDFLTNITATDDLDFDITENITVDYSAVDMDTAGVYEVIFEVSDSSNNKTTVSINVEVLEAITELILNETSVTFEVFDSLPNFLEGVSGYQLGEEEANIEVNYENVNPNQVGSYEITYTASLYNLIETKTVEVYVVDLTPPEITGISKITIEEGSEFNPNRYVSVQDNYDDKVDITLKFNGDYSTKIPGKYIITAVAIDKSGNQSDFTFELQVNKDENHIVLWTTIILGIVIVGASGALYYIRKKREY